MFCAWSPLQYWTSKHILPVSWGRIHHKGSLNRIKVVLVCKLCFVIHIWPLNNIKFVSQIIKNCKQKWNYFWLHVQYRCTHGINVYPSPFHQCKVTLNTICCRTKSPPHIEVCCLVVAGIEQMIFWTLHIGPRDATCWCVPASSCKYKSGSDHHNWHLLDSPSEF